MPYPRLPQEKARVTGAQIVNPGRFKDRSDPKTIPLGGPSNWIVGEQRIAWKMFQVELPWLMESDRVLVEIASCLRARLMSGEEVSVAALNQLRMCAGMMGATPADRTKITAPAEPETDPAEHHFH